MSIKFDRNQKEEISKFLTFLDKNARINIIKDSKGKIIGKDYNIPEIYSDKLDNILDLIIKHCEKQQVSISPDEVKELINDFLYNSKESNINHFTANLNKLIKDELTIIIPNYTLSFYKGDTEGLNFGDTIKCIPSLQMNKEITKIYANEEHLDSVSKYLPTTDYFFCIKVKLCTTDYASILARKNLDAALSLLEIFVDKISSLHPLRIERIFNRDALTPKSDQVYVVINKEGITVPSNHPGSSLSYFISPDIAEELEKLEFNSICNDIFLSTKILCQNIKRALYFMAKARIERDYDIRFVFLICALEAFLPKAKSSNNIKEKIKILVSSLGTVNNRDTISIINKFYDVRSYIIHSARNNTHTVEYELLKSMTKGVCAYYIKRIDTYEDTDSIFNALVIGKAGRDKDS